MRRVQQLVALLYPPKWRARYGQEFSALLEELEPRTGDLFNLFTGAIRMHMTEWGYLKFAAVFAAIGLLGGLLAPLVIPEQFQSNAVIGIPSAQKGSVALQHLFRRGVLKTVIEENDLYAKERLREPLEDVIEKMRAKNLRSHLNFPSQMTLAFTYPDRTAAQRTIQSLMSRLESDPAFHTISAASTPQRVSPNRLRLIFMCLGTSLLIGLVAIGGVRAPRDMLKTLVIYSSVGGILFGVGSLMIPNRYTSIAVLMSSDGKLFHTYNPSDELIAATITQRKLFGGDNDGRITTQDLTRRFRKQVKFVTGSSPGGLSLLYIYASSDDALEAQRLGQATIMQMFQNTGSPSSPFETTENASLPESPSSPNRVLIVGIGMGLGFLVGLLRMRFGAVRKLQSA